MLTLLTYPNLSLTTACQPIDLAIVDLLELDVALKTVCQEARGAGLAAPQIGHNLRAFGMQRIDGPWQLFVNPEIEPYGEITSEEEGCLSLPGITVRVPRPMSVRGHALDLFGKRFEFDETGFAARCIQHECDHLNGKLIVDHLKGFNRKYKLDQYLKNRSRYAERRVYRGLDPLLST